MKNLDKFETHDELVAHHRSFGKYEEYVPEFVYGGIDGAVTTFAVVAASAGAGISPGVVLILGISNMLADGLSMSIGSFLSTKSELEHSEHVRDEEFLETEKFPEDETEEIREIYAKKGFKGEILENIVMHITSDKKLWVDEMMIGEHGMIEEDKNPKMNALMTFISFCLLGAIPISPYFYAFITGIKVENAFLLACIFTGIAFMIVGYLKAKVNQANILKAIIETLSLGAVAAGVAYFVGDWLEKIIM